MQECGHKSNQRSIFLWKTNVKFFYLRFEHLLSVRDPLLQCYTHRFRLGCNLSYFRHYRHLDRGGRLEYLYIRIRIEEYFQIEWIIEHQFLCISIEYWRIRINQSMIRLTFLKVSWGNLNYDLWIRILLLIFSSARQFANPKKKSLIRI